jgi:hypothetical protein
MKLMPERGQSMAGSREESAIERFSSLFRMAAPSVHVDVHCVSKCQISVPSEARVVRGNDTRFLWHRILQPLFRSSARARPPPHQKPGFNATADIRPGDSMTRTATTIS